MRSEDMPLALKILIWSVLSKSFQLIISIVEVWYWSLMKCLKRPCGESTVEILSLLMQQRPRRERNNHKFENIIWHKDYKKPFFCGKSLPKGYSSNNRILLTTTFLSQIWHVYLWGPPNIALQLCNSTQKHHKPKTYTVFEIASTSAFWPGWKFCWTWLSWLGGSFLGL